MFGLFENNPQFLIIESVEEGARLYTGISPITVDNDSNQIGLNVGATDDWNGTFDGFEGTDLNRTVLARCSGDTNHIWTSANNCQDITNFDAAAAGGDDTFNVLSPVIPWADVNVTDVWTATQRFEGDVNIFSKLNVVDINGEGNDINFSQLQAGSIFGDISSATGYTLDDAYNAGGNTITVDTDDVIWNLDSPTDDFIIQDSGDVGFQVNQKNVAIDGQPVPRSSLYIANPLPTQSTSYAIESTVTHGSSVTAAGYSVAGFATASSVNNANTIASIYGRTLANGGSHDGNLIAGLFSGGNVLSSGTITNAYGVKIIDPTTTSGGVTNLYGLFIDPVTFGGSNYGIYVGDANTYSIWVDNGLTRLDGSLELQGDLNANDWSGDANFNNLEADFFFGDGSGLTNLPNGITGVFEGGNIDVNSNTGDVLVSLDDGNFLSFFHTWDENQLFANQSGICFDQSDCDVRIYSRAFNDITLSAPASLEFETSGFLRLTVFTTNAVFGSASSNTRWEMDFDTTTNSGMFSWEGPEDMFIYDDNTWIRARLDTEDFNLHNTHFLANDMNYLVDDLNRSSVSSCAGDANSVENSVGDCVDLSNFPPQNITVKLNVSDYNVSTLSGSTDHSGGQFGDGNYVLPADVNILGQSFLDQNIFVDENKAWCFTPTCSICHRYDGNILRTGAC